MAIWPICSPPPSCSQYKMFKLLNQEFTFTVDGSDLPCGLNGAIYFVEMEVTMHMHMLLEQRLRAHRGEVCAP